MMGSCIKAYMLCERKKREFIYDLSDSEEMDGEICKAFTFAQNEIFRELLFLDVMYREIQSIRDGVVITRTNTKKIRKGKRKSKKNKIEHVTGGGGLTLDKLKKTISLFLLFIFKAHAENSEVAVFQDRFESNVLALDPLNEEQMHEYTLRFGNLQDENYKPMKSANLVEKIHDNEEYYLYHSNTLDFHKDVRKQIVSLLNENINPVYERLLKICDVFIDQTTDTNPAEFGFIYSELSEQHKSDYQKNRLAYEQSLNKNKDIVMTKKQHSSWGWGSPQASAKPINNMHIVKGKDPKSITLVSTSNSLRDFDNSYYEDVARKIHDDDHRHMHILNRKKFLSGICRFSLKLPSLEYDEQEGTIIFNDFKNYRTYIDVIIRNVIVRSAREKATDVSKQTEMALFLQEVLIEWDSTFRDVVTNGHSGKRTMTGYGTKFKQEMETLHKFLFLGLKGNPIALRKAIQRRNEALNNKELNNITMEGKKIDSEIQKEINEYDNEETGRYWRQFTYVNTAFFSETFTYGVSGIGSFAKQSMYDIAVALSIPAAMLAATGLFIRWCWYKKINYDDSNFRYNNRDINQQQLTYNVDETKKKRKYDQKEILEFRPNTLKELKNKKCPESYTFVSRLQNCMPKKYSNEGFPKENYIKWYFNKKTFPGAYDPNTIYP